MYTSNLLVGTQISKKYVIQPSLLVTHQYPYLFIYFY